MASMSRIKVGLIGGTGYSGSELLRLLLAHENCDVTVVASRSESERAVVDAFPNLRGHCQLAFVNPEAEADSFADSRFCLLLYYR